MRALPLFVAGVIAVAACSTEAVVATPAETVAGWLAALDGDADPGDYVVSDQVALLAALGRIGDAPEIVSNGLSADSEADYWDSLAGGIAEVAGLPPSELTIGDSVALTIDGVEHAFVEVGGAGGSTVIVVRMDTEPLIDLVATLGPELVRPLTTLLRSLEADSFDGPGVAASLRVGLSEPGLDLPPEFYGEVQDLIAAIDP